MRFTHYCAKILPTQTSTIVCSHARIPVE